MGRRNKLIRFNYLKACPIVLEYGDILFENIKGKWRSEMFKNDNPIVLELGCGRGEYTIGMGELFPDKNFIGIDIKGSRIFKGAKYAIDTGMANVAFLRTQILLLEKFFDKDEVDEVWVTFPDPRPLDGDEKRRLFSPRFLKVYRQFLKRGGILNLKTDNYGLYTYALALCEELNIVPVVATDDLYNSPYQNECYDIKTTYEKRYLSEGVKINYLKIKV